MLSFSSQQSPWTELSHIQDATIPPLATSVVHLIPQAALQFSYTGFLCNSPIINLLFGIFFAYAASNTQKLFSAYSSLQTSLHLSKSCSRHSMMKSYLTPYLAPLTGLAQSSSTGFITLLQSLAQTFIFVPRWRDAGRQELCVFHLCTAQFLKPNLDQTIFKQMKEMAPPRPSSGKRLELIRSRVLFFQCLMNDMKQ